MIHKIWNTMESNTFCTLGGNIICYKMLLFLILVYCSRNFVSMNTVYTNFGVIFIGILWMDDPLVFALTSCYCFYI